MTEKQRQALIALAEAGQPMSWSEARRLDGYDGKDGAFLLSLMAQGWILVDRVTNAVTLTSAGRAALKASHRANGSDEP